MAQIATPSALPTENLFFKVAKGDGGGEMRSLSFLFPYHSFLE
jgi:hypothetical protein